MAEFKKNWLGSEVGMVLKTITIPKGTGVVKSGTIVRNGENLAIGILFNDVDVADGARVASMMIRGSFINENLPTPASSSDLTAFEKQGLYNTVYAETDVDWEVTE